MLVEGTAVSHRPVFNSGFVISTVQNRSVKQTLTYCWIWMISKHQCGTSRAIFHVLFA